MKRLTVFIGILCMINSMPETVENCHSGWIPQSFMYYIERSKAV